MRFIIDTIQNASVLIMKSVVKSGWRMSMPKKSRHVWIVAVNSILYAWTLTIEIQQRSEVLWPI